MTLSRSVYQAFEAVAGRSRAWRIGRWLYQGSRRELTNDPDQNGEYLLQRAWAASRQGKTAPTGGYRLVDVGANVGAWTANLLDELKAARLDDYRIWAFEPAPAQREALRRLCDTAIKGETVLVDPRGLGAQQGRAVFNVLGDTTGSNALAAKGEALAAGAIEIEVTTLDAVCAEQAVARLDVVKVDTEGNDFNVILGARGLFDRQAIDLLQFEYNWRWVGFGHWLREVFDFVEGRPYLLGRLTNAGLEIYDSWHPELERYIETNYAIVHEDILHALPHRRVSFDGSNTAVPPRSPS